MQQKIHEALTIRPSQKEFSLEQLLKRFMLKEIKNLKAIKSAPKIVVHNIFFWVTSWKVHAQRN